MGDDRIHGPLSRFIPSIEEYLEASRKAMRDSKEGRREVNPKEDDTG